MLPAALFAALAGLAVPAHSQTPAEAAAATRVQEKLRKVELLNLLLPVLLTPEQLRVILPPIEKARKEESELKGREAKMLRDLEGDLDKALKAGLDSRQVVPTETMTKAGTALNAMLITRRLFVDQQVDLVLEVVNKQLDSGQKKAAIGLIEPKWISPAKPETVEESARLRFWVGAVLMDPLAYDILVRLSRRTT